MEIIELENGTPTLTGWADTPTMARHLSFSGVGAANPGAYIPPKALQALYSF